MDVRCECCTTEYAFEESCIPPTGVRVRCTQCGHIFFVRRPLITPTPPARRPPTVPPDAWMVCGQDGRVYPFHDFSALHQWIADRRVVPMDLISRTGKKWRPLGDIDELIPLFTMAYSPSALRGENEVAGPPITADALTALSRIEDPVVGLRRRRWLRWGGLSLALAAGTVFTLLYLLGAGPFGVPLRAKADLQRAQAALELDGLADLAEARAILGQLLEEYPDYAEAQAVLARVAAAAVDALHESDPAEEEVASWVQVAVQAAQQAGKRRPGTLSADLALAEAYRIRGDIPEAATLLARHQADGAGPDLQVAAAQLLLAQAEQAAAALSLLRRAVEAVPQNLRARYLLAQALLATGEVASARAQVEAILERNGRHERARRLLESHLAQRIKSADHP